MFKQWDLCQPRYQIWKLCPHISIGVRFYFIQQLTGRLTEFVEMR